jgi:hypothetical protein
MKSIEFIGPSSIGKSTFLRAFSEHATDSRKWVTHAAVLEQLRPRPPGIAGRVLRKLRGAGNAPAEAGEINLFELYNDDIAVLTEIFISSLAAGDSDAWQKVQLSNYYFNSIIRRALQIHHEYHHPRLVLFDEGILQVGRITSYDPQTTSREALIRSAILPSAVVHFDLPDDTYRERIERRFRENGVRKFHRTGKVVTPDMLDQYIAFYKSMGFRKVEICHELGVPVLQLEADPAPENLMLLEHFMNSVHRDHFA